MQICNEEITNIPNGQMSMLPGEILGSLISQHKMFPWDFTEFYLKHVELLE